MAVDLWRRFLHLYHVMAVDIWLRFLHNISSNNNANSNRSSISGSCQKRAYILEADVWKRCIFLMPMCQRIKDRDGRRSMAAFLASLSVYLLEADVWKRCIFLKPMCQRIKDRDGGRSMAAILAFLSRDDMRRVSQQQSCSPMHYTAQFNTTNRLTSLHSNVCRTERSRECNMHIPVSPLSKLQQHLRLLLEVQLVAGTQSLPAETGLLC